MNDIRVMLLERYESRASKRDLRRSEDPDGETILWLRIMVGIGKTTVIRSVA